MKNFTAIYSTVAIKNIQYAFMAKDMKAAKAFAKGKFYNKVKIVED